MTYFGSSINKYTSVVLHLGDFDYTASNKETSKRILSRLKIDESEAKTTSNLLGIVEPNRASFSIIDYTGELIQASNTGDYKSLIKNGVKVEFFENNIDESIPPVKKGEYFVDGWSNNMIGTVTNTVNISCYDKLSYIGSKEIPNLDNLKSMDIKSVLISIFKSLGLVENTDYKIDSSLNLNLNYPVTKGSKVRDTLNEIAQALIARITCDRNGVIQIKPAFKNSGYTVSGILSDQLGSGFTIKNNKDIGNYTYVKVGYADISVNDVSDTLARLNSVKISASEAKTLKDIEIPKNTQVIDAVQCVGLWDQDSKGIKVLGYDRTQNGIDIKLKNQDAVSREIDVVVKGRSIITTNAYAFDTTKDTSGNVFEINNIYIQDSESAQDFANKIKEYILSIKHRYSITAYIDMEIKCGDYIQVESDSSSLNGIFYVNGLSFSISNNYQVTIDAIKVK